MKALGGSQPKETLEGIARELYGLRLLRAWKAADAIRDNRIDDAIGWLQDEIDDERRTTS